MLDILTIVHSFADIQTASRIRRTCRRLAALIPDPILYNYPTYYLNYVYRVGTKLHRLDGPAKECIDGFKRWYRRGIAHREYHPQCTNGTYKTYMVDDVYHREAGPSVVYRNGGMWYMRGNVHRKTGPAYIRGREVSWCTLGSRHRLDGPAYRNIYAIRGVAHSIFCIMYDGWRINDICIRS